MTLIIIFMIIGIVVGIFEASKDSWNSFIDYFISSSFGALIGGIVGFLVAWMLPMDTYDKHISFKIETLQDNNSVDGNFFLGCGQIEGKMKYVFYYEEREGIYRMMQLDYDLVQIKYSDEPKVNVTENYPTDAFINHFAIDMDAFHKTYIIEVPKGTIKNNYNLDAQ